MSSQDLEREIISAWQRGWYLWHKGHGHPKVNSSLQQISYKGWDSCLRGESCEEGLERFLMEKSEKADQKLRDTEAKLSQEFDQCVGDAASDIREIQRLQRFHVYYSNADGQEDRDEKIHILLLSAKTNITAAYDRW